jgi:hypothetical protein
MKLLLLLPLLLTGCAMTTTDAGFLDDYSILKSNPDVPNSRRWISNDIGQYDRVLVAPVVAYFHANVQGKPVDANELDDMLTRLRSCVIEALAENSLMATEAGPGVIRLEVAVTDLHEKQGKGSGLGLGSANLELRATDSTTGTLLAAAAFPARLGELGANSDVKWAPVREAAKSWAVRIQQALDAAREAGAAG